MRMEVTVGDSFIIQPNYRFVFSEKPGDVFILNRIYQSGSGYYESEYFLVAIAVGVTLRVKESEFIRILNNMELVKV